MSNLIIENQQKDWSKFSMAEVIDNQLDFDVESWRITWPVGENSPFLTGGFIDPTKKKCYRIWNPYQVIAAAVTKSCVNVIIGKKSDSQNDFIEIPIDFSMNNIYILNPKFNEKTEEKEE